MIFGALIGAIAWNIITWYYGIPSSSSHALIGGLVGAAVAKGGVHTLIASGFLKTAAAIVLSPAARLRARRRADDRGVVDLAQRSTPRRVDRWFRRLQLVSAALYSLGPRRQRRAENHGHHLDAADRGRHDRARRIRCRSGWCSPATARSALGTLFGGWRIVKTMGQSITKLKPVGGFCAETGGAITLFLATALGVPVSTTHTITGAIVGVGSVQKLSAVRWGVAGNIVWAWMLTIPCSAFVAAVAWWLAQHYF